MSSDLVAVESRLWATADQLWANTGLKPSEFSTPVLGLIFLRYADKRFTDLTQALHDQGTPAEEIDAVDYQAEGVLFLPEEARFSHLLTLTEGANMGKAIATAMSLVEEHNPELKGVLPRGYDLLPNATLVELLRLLAPLDLEGDAFGKVYEYFLGNFALKEGQKGGVYYTPTSIVRLIVEILQPFHGRIFDPACGSGGMFVQSAAFVQRHQKNATRELTVFGTEKASDTVKLAKMNLAVHGLSGDVREANTYYEDPHNAFGRFDFVMANPPFNVSAVNWDRLKDDKRLPLGIPAADNANYLWIQVFLSSLNDTGRAGFVIHNSAADAEARIRQEIIDQKIVDVVLLTSANLFYTVSLPCTLWFFDKGKHNGTRGDQILFVDARKIFRQVDTAIRDVTEEQVERIAAVVRSYREEPDSAPYADVPGFCKRVELSAVRGKRYSLNPKLYVENAGRADDDSEPFDAAERVNDGLLDVATRSGIAFAQLGQVLPLDRSLLLSYSTLMNVKHFRGWRNGPPLRDMFSSYIGGTWGEAERTAESTEAVRVIRGTDIPRVMLGELSTCPIRYVKPSQLRSRKLQQGDLILEVSGGGKEVATGRSAVVTDSILAASAEPLVCASFCKRLVPNREVIDPWTLYFFLQYLYAHGVMGQYEVQSTGIKNFQTETFLNEVCFDGDIDAKAGPTAGLLVELTHAIGAAAESLSSVSFRADIEVSMLDLETPEPSNA